ncbi:MAG: glucose-1-phosphate cytidylyltransferase [Polyangiaceae bacterium]
MKAVILAGGLGTRLSEETVLKPKPMVEVGGRPLLWHILKIYSHWGIREFVICLGYRGYVIKEYFANYLLHMSDVTLDLRDGSMEVHKNEAESWKVTLVDTGLDTMTGGRVKRIAPYIGNETFLLTYGDGVSDVDISKTLEFHRQHGKAATLVAAQPPGRFGQLGIATGGAVHTFEEKPEDGGWINGGFFVLESSVFATIAGDSTVFEREPLQQLASQGQLCAYKHPGFWQCVDTVRDRNRLEELWATGSAPWKLWNE